MTPTEEEMDPRTAWSAVLGDLQLQLPRPTFDTWLKSTSYCSYEDGEFIISTPNPYAVEWLQNRLRRTITTTAARIMERTVSVRFIVRPEITSPEDEALFKEDEPLFTGSPNFEGNSSRVPPDSLKSGPPLNSSGNPRYTFDTFIVGNGNRMAHAASTAVAERPAEKFNPLFIYGGVGLGKTHLLQAVAHEVSLGGYRAGYLSSEVFTNELINAIRHQNTEPFRDRYRSLDILLIDDIQFIAGKESTQEEFFHTFNTLHGLNKQVIISSDRPPRAMLTLEERLRSRFEGGLVVDIQPPDLETRIAILRFRAESQTVHVPDDVIQFIARKFQSNIRELEGALTKVIAHSQFTQLPLSIGLTEQALRDILQKRRSVRMEDIIRAVALYYDLPQEDLLGKRRTKRVAIPRQVAMFLCRELTDSSLPQIGASLGGRDHTTIIYGCAKIKKTIEADLDLRKDVLSIKESLYYDSSSSHSS